MNTKIGDFVSGLTDFLMLYDENGNPAFLIERDDIEKSGTHLYQEYLLDNKDNDYQKLWNKYYRNYIGAYKEEKPKSMGGKKPYVMLMTKEIKELKCKLKQDGVKNHNEIIGSMIDFSEYLDWGTGQLVDKRQRLKKKQLPLKYNDLLEISGYSKTKFENIMKTMREYELLRYENHKGYFISRIYFKKGGR